MLSSHRTRRHPAVSGLVLKNSGSSFAATLEKTSIMLGYQFLCSIKKGFYKSMFIFDDRNSRRKASSYLAILHRSSLRSTSGSPLGGIRSFFAQQNCYQAKTVTAFIVLKSVGQLFSEIFYLSIYAYVCTQVRCGPFRNNRKLWFYNCVRKSTMFSQEWKQPQCKGVAVVQCISFWPLDIYMAIKVNVAGLFVNFFHE